VAIELLIQHPITGVGLNAYDAAARGELSLVLTEPEHAYRAHSAFFTVLAELGLVGVLVFGRIILSCYRAALTATPPKQQLWLFSLITWTFLAAFDIWSTTPLTWILFALTQADYSNTKAKNTV